MIRAAPGADAARTTPHLSFVLLCVAGFVSAQDCQVDSSLLQTGGLLSPTPYSDQNPQYNLAVACIGSPYNQSVTVNVPSTFSGFPIDSVGIAAAGASNRMRWATPCASW